MPMDTNTSNYDNHVFIVQGVKVSANFPKEPNDTTMDMVKNILITAYVNDFENYQTE